MRLSTISSWRWWQRMYNYSKRFCKIDYLAVLFQLVISSACMVLKKLFSLEYIHVLILNSTRSDLYRSSRTATVRRVRQRRESAQWRRQRVENTLPRRRKKRLSGGVYSEFIRLSLGETSVSDSRTTAPAPGRPNKWHSAADPLFIPILPSNRDSS